MMAGRAPAGRIVAAVLLPPLAVFLERGLGSSFWIAVVLTLLWWLPGIAFALAVVLKPALLARA